jgi:hypothetical protein
VNYLFDPTSPAGEFAHSRYLTATSPKATGPFTIRNDNVSTLHWPPGDYSVWPDEAAGDGTAYIIYTSISTHQMTVERLTDDWLGSTMNSSGVFGDKGVEAPVLFRRAANYYALFDKECCYCPQGSGAVVYTAPHPLGPWTRHQQIGRYPPPPPPPPCPAIKNGHECKLVNCSWVNQGKPPVGHCETPLHPALGASVPKAQQRYVFWYPPVVAAAAGLGTRLAGLSGAPTLVWAGNRWQSAPDRLKDHDFNTWLPLPFGDPTNRTAPALPLQMHWVDSFTLGAAGAALNTTARVESVLGAKTRGGYNLVANETFRERVDD